MILFYIDESGTGIKDTKSLYFVLAALGIPATEWQTADGEIAALKGRVASWAKSEDFEIKGRDIRRGEKFFKGMSWGERVNVFQQTARLISDLSCHIHAVQVDTRDLPEYIANDTQLYRLAFWRLLEEIDTVLSQMDQPGMLLVDMRSDMHSSIQDRRVVDAYRGWVASRMGRTQLVGLPWFGFSAFYPGLQLADFVAYLIDFASNELQRSERDQPLYDVYAIIQSQITLVRIP